MSFALDIIFVARKLNYISSINISGKPHNKICMIKCNSLNFPQFNTENIKAKLESKVLMKDYVRCISLRHLCTTLLLHSAESHSQCNGVHARLSFIVVNFQVNLLLTIDFLFSEH